jgi:hypothetical protein
MNDHLDFVSMCPFRCYVPKFSIKCYSAVDVGGRLCKVFLFKTSVGREAVRLNPNSELYSNDVLKLYCRNK